MKAGSTSAAMTARWVRRALFMRVVTSFPLEAEVLERLSSAPVQMGGVPVAAAPGREVAEGDPRRSTVAHGRELLERRVGSPELLFGLVEPALLEQRAAEDELRVADLVEEVDATVEQRERMARLLLGLIDVPRAQVNLGER